jgi:RNA polymerase sigma-70 factor, ECF subfamily
VTTAAGALERAFRDERAAVPGTLTRRLDGDLALGEDVDQDAFVAAAVEWDRRGVPDRPGAWLTTTTLSHLSSVAGSSRASRRM